MVKNLLGGKKSHARCKVIFSTQLEPPCLPLNPAKRPLAPKAFIFLAFLFKIEAQEGSENHE
jgi:hypothetical protein